MYETIIYRPFISACDNTQCTAWLSGSALNFNGTSDYVNIPHNSALDPSTNFTVEAWIKADAWAVSSWQNTIVSKDQWTAVSEGWVLRCGANGTLSFNLALNNNGNWYEVTSTPLMSVNKWYHVAGTYDGSTLRLYLNGKQVGTLAQVGTITPSSAPVKIGNIAMTGQNRFFDGQVDEVRIWNATLTEAALRTYMCHKIDVNHPNLSSLTAHYTLNAGSGTTAFDQSLPAYNGTLLGASWVVSGVPLGDGGDYVYNTNWSGKSFKYGHPNGDSMLISNLTGNPDGAHIYFVDAQPNYSSPPPGVLNLSQNRYYGVYLTAGMNPTYTATFEYDGLPGIFNQSEISLNYRTDNADSTWSTLAANQDTILKTFIKTNSTYGEFVIGWDDDLSSFTLNAPSPASNFTLSGASNQTIGFNWFESKLGARGAGDYRWYLDYDTASFTSPLGSKISASAGKDSLVNLTYAELATHMNISGMYYGETLNAKWTVKATAGPLERYADQPHTISLTRGILSSDAIFAFMLETPDNDTISVYNGGTALNTFKWAKANSTAGPDLGYEVQIAAETGTFNNPLGTFGADSSGYKNEANISDADLALMLQNTSIPNNYIIKLKWRVRANIGTLLKNSLDSNIVYMVRNDDPSIGINEMSQVGSFHIYPIPATNELNILIKGYTDKMPMKLSIINNLGSLVFQGKIESEGVSNFQIPAEMENGLYFIILESGNIRMNQKLTILR